jgi:prepilin-type N-terminal cleavage/methylation domain-containing protein
MISRKGFTLIELMVVIFIVGILAAVAIPIMRGRIDAAKWSEGKAAAGSIRTAARAFIAERGNAYTYSTATDDLVKLGFATGDLDGKYFSTAAYGIAWVDNGAAVPPSYTITVTATSSTCSEAPSVPYQMTLNQAGDFVEVAAAP